MHPRPPILLLALPLALLSFRCAPPAGHVPVLDALNCTLMPDDSYWHADVSALPVHPRSDAWVQRIGLDEPLDPTFGTGLQGIPYEVVDPGQPMVPVSFRFFLDADPGPYPIPPGARIEGGPGATGDRHLIVLDRGACRLYELSEADPQPDGSWDAASGAIFDLSSNALHPDGRLSADDSGMPILPGLVRYEEVALGLVGHALRVTSPVTRRARIWPARNFVSSANNPTLPPMGAWFRLKSDVDPADFSPMVRPIVEALQRHGMILADEGAPWSLSGIPSPNWNDGVLDELRTLTGADFEAVDASLLQVDPDSGATMPYEDDGADGGGIPL